MLNADGAFTSSGLRCALCGPEIVVGLYRQVGLPRTDDAGLLWVR
jgi:hypothetical protein